MTAVASKLKPDRRTTATGFPVRNVTIPAGNRAGSGRPATEAHPQEVQPLVRWLEATVSPKWQKPGTAAMVHAIRLGDSRSCFGVTLDRRWLCSSEGAPTVFDSMATATRFLNLLNLRPMVSGEHYDAGTVAPQTFQCFRLDANGLAPCGNCPADQSSGAPHAGDTADWEERW